MMGKSFNPNPVVGQDGGGDFWGTTQGRGGYRKDSRSSGLPISSNITGKWLHSAPEFSRITPFQGEILCIAAARVCER